MAKSKKAVDNKVTFKKLNRIWTDVDSAAWAAWLVEQRPDCMWRLSGNHVKGRCPFHEDSTASFYLSPHKMRASCFGCRRGWWSPIHFIAEVNKTSVADALLFAKKRWGLSAAIPKEMFETIRAHEVYQRHKTSLMKFFADLLFQCMASYSRGQLEADGLGWAGAAVEYLLARRLGENGRRELVPPGQESTGEFDQYGVWVSLICSHQLLGIFPPTSYVRDKFGASSEEAKFFESYFAKCIGGQTYHGHLVFPYDDTPTSLARFKLREPAKPTISQLWVDDDYEAQMGSFRGFYGLRYYGTYLSDGAHGADGPDKGHYGYVSEGEFDTLAAIAQQARRASDDYIALGLSGSAAQGVDKLYDLGVLRVRFLPDRDDGGVKFVKQVLEETAKKDFGYRVFAWPGEYADWRDPARPDASIKDVDDAIRELGYPRWVRHCRDDNGAFVPINEWCYDQASAVVSATNSRDIAAISRVAKDWGSLIRDEQVCIAFCNAISTSYGLDSVTLRRDIFVKDDNEEEFIKRLHTTLLVHYHPLGLQNVEGRKKILLMWDKATRVTSGIVLGDESSAETFVAGKFGPVYDFVAATVGDPPFIVGEDPDEPPPFNITMKAKKYRFYVKEALLRVAKGLPSMDHAQTRSQGVHMAHVTESQMRSYMVNGRDVYVLSHDEANFTATALDGPRHEEFIFNNSGRTWIESVAGAEDLVADVDLVELFWRVRDMLATGWAFRHQDLDCTFLAAYVMCLGVMTVFTRQTAIITNAEHQAGKSKLTAGFIGGTSFRSINVVAHAVAMQGYTAASIRQNHSDTSLCLCLEEFEDYGGNDAKSIAVRKVLELIRDLISENAVHWSIGTATGEAKTYRLRFPLATCSIRPLRDAASLSRFVRFELVKDDARVSPESVLLAKYGDDGIAKTRHDMFVGMLPHMLTLRRLQTLVEKEYASGAALPAHASSRFREALVPVLCMLRLLGDLARASDRPDLAPDYKKFAYDFAESRREQLAQLKTTSQDEQVFEALVSSSFQLTNIKDKEAITDTTSIRKMLGELNKLEDINKTMVGVYLDTKMEWLVVNWIEATSGRGVLSMSELKRNSPSWLKDIAQRSPHHVPVEEVKAARVLDRLVDVMGPCQRLDVISVFSVRHMLDEVRARREQALKKASTPADEPEKEEEIDPDQAQGDDDIVV
jgi:hypothetical protein